MLISGSLLGTILTLSGCGLLGDSDLQAQIAAQAELKKAASEYTVLIGTVSITNDQQAVADEVDQLIRSVESIDGLSDAQKKSASNLVSAMHGAAGDLRANTLMQLQLDQAMLREQIAEQAAAAMILAAGAAPRTTSDFAEPRNLITQMKAGVDAQHESVQTGIASMQPQINQMMQQRERSTEQLNSLQSDMAQLRQRANDAGPVEGYPLVEEAAGMKSRAIPVKTAIAEAEVQLSTLQPDIQRMELERTSIEALRDATQRAEELTTRLQEAVQAAGEAGQQRASEMVQALKKNLAAYEAREQNEIGPLREQTISNLQKAQRGRRGGTGANAARMLGDLHALRADAAQADASLFTALAATGDLGIGNAGTWTTMATTAEETHASAIEAARTAYEAALEKLAQSRNNEAARASVETLISALDGTSIIQDETLSLAPAPPTRGERPGGGRPGGGGDLAGAMGTMGFDTPEALADFMNGLSKRTPSPQMLREVVGASYTSNSETLAEMTNPQATGQMVGMLGGMTGGMEMTVDTISGTSGTLAPLNPPPNMPIKLTFPIIQIDGKWLLDVDALQAQMENMMNAAFENMNLDLEGGNITPPGRGGRTGTDRPGRGRSRN
jgi:hypothetical protein